MPERDIHLATAQLRSAAVLGTTTTTPAAASTPAPHQHRAHGRVLQVNTSRGGVPKLPVPDAYVGELGLEGDEHRDMVSHGGPLRAVCLLAQEAIDRVAAEGNPIAPGTTGENVTTQGIELGALPFGTQLAIGPGVVIELTLPVNPCTNIADSFADGDFSRLSIKRYPLDIRVYAKVLREGTISAGDEIRVLA